MAANRIQHLSLRLVAGLVWDNRFHLGVVETILRLIADGLLRRNWLHCLPQERRTINSMHPHD